jgi:putative flippase GtrA
LSIVKALISLLNVLNTVRSGVAEAVRLAAANFGSRFIFSLWMRYEWAVLLAFLVGIAVGFLLMRAYVFYAQDKALGPQLIRFVAVNPFAAVQTFVISVVLAHWAFQVVGVESYAEAIGHFAGVVAPIITSYFGHRLLTFR